MSVKRRHLNFYVPAAWVARIDELAGPRGRSEWLRGAVRRALVESGGLPPAPPPVGPDPRQTVLLGLQTVSDATPDRQRPEPAARANRRGSGLIGR